jgi:hypothetical protein
VREQYATGFVERFRGTENPHMWNFSAAGLIYARIHHGFGVPIMAVRAPMSNLMGKLQKYAPCLSCGKEMEVIRI